VTKNVHDGETAVSTIANKLNELLSLKREIKELAATNGDHGTEDLMSNFIDQREKTFWMMNAWLK
jgi:starvation-inducible DNA-binding protein